MLIAAISGRSLAASARRAGYRPLVADFFGDDDTLALAHRHVRLTKDFRRGIDRDELMDALGRLADSAQPEGLVCGSGFEDRPQLLAELSTRWRLLGNPAEAVARAKDPVQLAALCRELAIPHPPTTTERPAAPGGWVMKRRGGAGGSHVQHASASGPARDGLYYQQRVDGAAVSALVLADAEDASVLGLSSQWSSPTPQHPFRYGGAVRPATVAAPVASALADAARRLVQAIPLLGLNSVDFVVAGREFWVLEVNPRPGATLDIFDLPNGALLGLHIAACGNGLSAEPRPAAPGIAMAQGIVYARGHIVPFPSIDWPDWTADRQAAGSAVMAGEPVCTVLAPGSTAGEARELLEQRMMVIRACVDARMS